MSEKASFVRWKNNERKESYAVFARSFYKKIDEWNGKRVYCFDIKEIENIFRLSP